jgi:hypothetical protein
VVVYAPEKAGAEGATAGSEGQVVPHIGGVGEAAALSTAAKEARSYREALVRTGLSVGAAIAFGLGVWYVRGQTSAMEFFAGYLIEESLSIDNIFVFIMLFDYFKVPMDFQPRALTWGIVGAIAMRGVMILVGVAALQKFRWVVLVFAGLLLASAGKLLMGHEDDGELSENFMLKATSRLFPSTPNYDGDRFFTKVGGSARACFCGNMCAIDPPPLLRAHLLTAAPSTPSPRRWTASVWPRRCSCAWSASSSPTSSSPWTPSPRCLESPRYTSDVPPWPIPPTGPPPHRPPTNHRIR